MLNNKEEAQACIDILREMAERLEITDIANVVLDDPKFLVWSGSSKPHQHHYRDYGLLEHTTEVVSLCIINNVTGNFKIDKKDLYLAALFHDIGKTYDYERFNVIDHEPYIETEDPIKFKYYWGSAPHKREIHHISRSAIIWSKAAEKFNYPEENVLHAILAHHGQREWGSPVMPNTKLAWLLHLCDGISARMDDAAKWDMTKQGQK